MQPAQRRPSAVLSRRSDRIVESCETQTDRRLYSHSFLLFSASIATMSNGNGGGGGSSSSAAAESSTSVLPSAPSPDYDRFWTQASSSAAPHISSIRRRLPHFPSAPLRIQRVSQLDAELLDEELTTMLLEPLKASLAQIKSTLPDRWEPELLALLKLVLYKYSIVDRGASYGAMLQNLRYRNEWAHKGGRESQGIPSIDLTHRD